MAKLLIASEYVDSESNETTAVKNPATGELVDSVPKGTVNDIRRAIDAAKGALKKWSEMAPSKRGAILLQAGHAILQQEKELATLLTREQGKPTAGIHFGDPPLCAYFGSLRRNGKESAERCGYA